MNGVGDLIPTKKSLIGRLKDWNDQASWETFFDTYWKLIYSAARKAGLNDAEAQDVVQETVISVLKKMPGFEYDKEKGSFKSWLLCLTTWRITDQFRKRQPELEHSQAEPSTTTEPEVLETVADPAGLALQSIWDEEWESNLMEAAVDRVKKQVDSKQYQIFDLYVVKKWPATKVARALKVSAGNVYLTKHRISRLIKKELTYLRTKPI